MWYKYVLLIANEFGKVSWTEKSIALSFYNHFYKIGWGSVIHVFGMKTSCFKEFSQSTVK